VEPPRITSPAAALPSPKPDDDLASQLEELRLEAERTGNPLLVWAAIKACRTAAISEAVQATETAEELAMFAGGAACKPLPDWVVRYLFLVARDLLDLAMTRDPRAFHALPHEGGSARKRDATRAWQAGGLTPEEAARIVPWALGLTRPGYSAFRDFVAANYGDYLKFRFRTLRGASGMTGLQAAERIAAEEGYADGRSVLRAMSKANRRSGGQTS
jgi:hypothetical protein